MKILLVAIGGSLGALSRYFFCKFTPLVFNGNFPFGTLGVNTVGCFLAGLLFGFMPRQTFTDHPLFFLLAVGFLGSFTTFSAFAIDNLNLAYEGRMQAAAWNVASNIVFAGIAVFLGFLLGGTFAGGTK